MNQNTELRPLLSSCLPISPHTDLSFLEDKGSNKVLPQLQTDLWSSAISQQATWSQRQRPLPQHYRAWVRATLTSPTLSHECLLNISIMKSRVGQTQNKNKKEQAKEFFWKENTFLDTGFAGFAHQEQIPGCVSPLHLQDESTGISRDQ